MFFEFNNALILKQELILNSSRNFVKYKMYRLRTVLKQMIALQADRSIFLLRLHFSHAVDAYNRQHDPKCEHLQEALLSVLCFPLDFLFPHQNTQRVLKIVSAKYARYPKKFSKKLRNCPFSFQSQEPLFGETTDATGGFF